MADHADDWNRLIGQRVSFGLGEPPHKHLFGMVRGRSAAPGWVFVLVWGGGADGTNRRVDTYMYVPLWTCELEESRAEPRLPVTKVFIPLDVMIERWEVTDEPEE